MLVCDSPTVKTAWLHSTFVLFHLSLHAVPSFGAQRKVNLPCFCQETAVLLSGLLDHPGFGEVTGCPCRSSCGRSFGKPVRTGTTSPGSIPAPMLMQLEPISWQTSWLLSKEFPPDWLAHWAQGMAVMKFEWGDKGFRPSLKVGIFDEDNAVINWLLPRKHKLPCSAVSLPFCGASPQLQQDCGCWIIVLNCSAITWDVWEGFIWIHSCATLEWDGKAQGYFSGNAHPTPTQDSVCTSFMWHALHHSRDWNTSWRSNSLTGFKYTQNQVLADRNKVLADRKMQIQTTCSNNIPDALTRPRLPMDAFWMKSPFGTRQDNLNKKSYEML